MPTTINQESEQRHTEEIQDIIGAPPIWLLRWGITLFFTVLVLILGVAEVIRYPDIVKTQLKIRSLSLPQPVGIKESGKLVKLLVQNNQLVKSGQTLAVIESAAGQINIIALQSGELIYAGIVHENQEFLPNQNLFYITNNDQDFFGEMTIPQGSIGKIKVHQEVIIKVRSYPYEEYGMLHGNIKYITNNPVREGEYIAEVDFKTKNLTDTHKILALKQGMMAEAEIITQNSSLLKRLSDNIFKNINR